MRHLPFLARSVLPELVAAAPLAWHRDRVFRWAATGAGVAFVLLLLRLGESQTPAVYIPPPMSADRQAAPPPPPAKLTPLIGPDVPVQNVPAPTAAGPARAAASLQPVAPEVMRLAPLIGPDVPVQNLPAPRTPGSAFGTLDR